MARKQLPTEPVEAIIESLSHEGRGITHINGKTVFIDEALPGETVRFSYTSRRAKYDEGTTVEVITASPQRVEPGCPHFSVCGGCSLQHMQAEFQINHKQQVLIEQLRHIGGTAPERILPPLIGPVWGYRHKARLGVKYVVKKGKVLVGFREKRKPYIADIDSCAVLHPVIGHQISRLKTLLDGLSIRDQIPQIEVAVDDSRAVLVVRHLAELSADDRTILAGFEQESGIRILLQGGNIDSITPLTHEDSASLCYTINDYDIAIDFDPLDFTQINFGINREMIGRVIELLAPDKSERVLDLFCGLGNFTLPLARRAAQVTGVEGAAALVAKAVINAKKNNIDNTEFIESNLYATKIQGSFMQGSYDKVLLDPPRSGAREVIEQMNFRNVSRVVYVSCNVATLARDTGILVSEKGYRLVAAGVMDMFPHTTHVESIALFEKT